MLPRAALGCRTGAERTSAQPVDIRDLSERLRNTCRSGAHVVEIRGKCVFSLIAVKTWGRYRVILSLITPKIKSLLSWVFPDLPWKVHPNMCCTFPTMWCHRGQKHGGAIESVFVWPLPKANNFLLLILTFPESFIQIRATVIRAVVLLQWFLIGVPNMGAL